jgi:hypothetical protein
MRCDDDDVNFLFYLDEIKKEILSETITILFVLWIFIMRKYSLPSSSVRYPNRNNDEYIVCRCKVNSLETAPIVIRGTFWKWRRRATGATAKSIR